MKNAGDASFNIELFEYGYLVEDTDPCATSMKVYVPKLSGTKTPSAEEGFLSLVPYIFSHIPSKLYIFFKIPRTYQPNRL